MVLLCEIQFLLFHNNSLKNLEPQCFSSVFPNLQDVNDVLAAIDHVIEKGLVDPSKISVLGGSHGGFLTTHLIGQVSNFLISHRLYGFYVPIFLNLWSLTALFNKHLQQHT